MQSAGIKYNMKKGTAFEATLHNKCVDEVYLKLKGDMLNLKTFLRIYQTVCVYTCVVRD